MDDMGTYRTTVRIGNIATRGDMGFALVHAGGTLAPDFVVFGEPGDMVLLGAHSLEGLNLRVDPIRTMLVDAGPIVAAAAA